MKARKPRSETVGERFVEKFPEVQYQFVQFFSDHLIDCCRTFGGDMQEVVVLAVLGQHHLQNTHRIYPTANARTSEASITASRIADVLNMSRETVRRKLKLLAARGWVRQTETGAWELVGEVGDEAARNDLEGLSMRNMERLARLYVGLEKLVGAPRSN